MTIPHVEEKKANFLRSGLEVNSLAKLVSFTKNKKVETLENIGLSQGNFDNIKKNNRSGGFTYECILQIALETLQATVIKSKKVI